MNVRNGRIFGCNGRIFGFTRMPAGISFHVKRRIIAPFLPYLRILHHAGSQALKHKVTLWRGVALHLPEYEKTKGQVIVWNTVSSTTPNKSVALSFLGIQGKRTLFQIDAKNAVSIQAFSAFQSEEEYLLLPGTKLKIENVTHQASGICLVHLLEV